MSRGERVQEMGIDHREFFRTLPRAMCGRPWSRDGLRVAVAVEGGDCAIEIGPERQRSIANITLPVTEVTIRWDGPRDDEIGRLLSDFDRHYQRGGG